MRISITSVPVQNQEHALKFYTEVLGFVKATDIPVGDGNRWLTVSSPEGAAGVELLLEPMGHPAAAVYQKALYDSGMPYTAFNTNDIQAEYERLKAAGVVFRVEPSPAGGGAMYAMFEDTCGNIINLYQAQS